MFVPSLSGYDDFYMKMAQNWRFFTEVAVDSAPPSRLPTLPAVCICPKAMPRLCAGMISLIMDCETGIRQASAMPPAPRQIASSSKVVQTVTIAAAAAHATHAPHSAGFRG
jgi:hypothetical protein|eukprot:COSAG06_NODE_18057_length_905_cov_302.780397_1_plen_111_part_00